MTEDKLARWLREWEAAFSEGINGWVAFGEFYPELADTPRNLKAIAADLGRAVLVEVRCADHNVLVGIVLGTSSGRLLLLTANESVGPNMRERFGDSPYGPWKPVPTVLTEHDQPDLYCPRCRTPRQSPDLLAIAMQARATRRQCVRA